MQYTLKNNIIKIDNGDHYYTGDVTPDMFPEEIRDNYEEIINQSFENYSDDKYNVTLTLKLDGPVPLIFINFQYKVKPFSFKRSITIPIIYHLKEFKDYTNERIEKLENEIISLKDLISVLLEEKKIDNKIDDSQTDDEDDDDEDEEKEALRYEQAGWGRPVKGSKKTCEVIQTKSTKKVVSKK